MSTMSAKFPGRCRACGDSFGVGAKIDWTKSTGAKHVSCPSVAAAAAPVTREAAPTADVAPYVAFENLEPCRRAALANAVGETRRYAGVRGAKVRGSDRTAAPAGVYVVVAQDAKYWSEEDTDDMGETGAGAHWSVTLYLRAATSEETATDEGKRVAAAMPALGAAIAKHVDTAAKVAADALVAAGEARVELWVLPGLAAISATTETLWTDSRGSYRTRIILATGEVLHVSHNYIYDWDQPIVVTGPREAVERVELGAALVAAGGWIASMARRAERA